MPPDISPAEMNVLTVYETFLKEHGRAPSYSQAGKLVGIAPSAVHYHVERLATRGYMGSGRGHRNVWITEQGMEVLNAEPDVAPLLRK